MSDNLTAIESLVKKLERNRKVKKKTKSQALRDFQNWKDGKVDRETTLPRPPRRLR